MDDSVEIAYHAYDINETFRSKLILQTIKEMQVGRYTRTAKCIWEKNIVLSLTEIEERLKSIFNVVTAEHCTANSPQMTFLLKSHSITDPYVIDLSIREDVAEYTIFTCNAKLLQEAEDCLLANFKLYQSNPSADKVCSFRFHHKSTEGVESRTQEIAAISLSDIRDNYTSDIFAQVEKLANMSEPYTAGKIILYHGPPGNGKTHLIRALAYQWSQKFDVQPEVVIDPEPLFEQPGYLMELLTTPDFLNKKPQFRFIIAEDCANLFGANCRDSTGFTRLLNVVDGLLGAGQKLVFLFTANEEIHEIDPAILRPGRCLQHLHIPNWDRENSAAWLTRRGSAAKICRLAATNSLADLYAIHNDMDIFVNRKEAFGF
jgi:hypothetical protein